MLPNRFQILPYSIHFSIPEFYRFKKNSDQTLAPSKVDCEEWFRDFILVIQDSIGKRYLPICRMSDGEFLFLFGDKPDFNRNMFVQLYLNIFFLAKKIFNTKKTFKAGVKGVYDSGQYSNKERELMFTKYTQMLKKISERGILAMHLSYIEKPFQEKFFPSIGNWLRENNIKLTVSNYYPFYFVYAALIGSERRKILAGKKILIIHSAIGEKKDRIIKTLYNEEVNLIKWLNISNNRSLFDKIDITEFIGKIDLVLLGAGIGKPNILLQLEKLSVPCIDAGYVFEIWYNEENKFLRAGCASDLDWQIVKKGIKL